MSYREIAATMRRLALLGGVETLKHFRAEGLAVEAKADDSPVTIADRAADQAIVAGLEAAHPSISVVTEERGETHLEAAPDRFFLVDPLDGTKEFISGDGAYTVNIALIERGVPTLGAVYAPAMQRLFWTPDADICVEERGEIRLDEIGATSHCRVRAANPDALDVVASKSHRGAETDAYIAKRSVGTIVSAGSSLKFCMIAAGEADLYPRLGRTMEWDTAAAHAALSAAGGEVVRYSDGAPLRYGKQGFENPHFVAFGGGVDLEVALDG